MASNSLSQLAAKLTTQAKADPKKAFVLVALMVVMVVMWARLAGGPGSGPAQASANIAEVRAVTGIKPDNSKTSPRASSAAASFNDWARRPIAPISRNLFIVNYDFFPQDGSKPAPLRAPQGNGFWDQLAKSMTSRADQKKERDVLVENLRLQAAQLKVQSTVMGASPKALINGDLVGVGDVVALFRVSKIEARRIVVEREGIKLEIRFNQ